MSIIACCRLACASLLSADGSDAEDMADVLQAAYDPIDATAGELEATGQRHCCTGRCVTVLIGAARVNAKEDARS